MLSVLRTSLAAFGLLGVFVGPVCAGFEEDREAKKWEEAEVRLPAAPGKEGLLGFYVSATTDNKFFVDPTSIAIGGDGVVRFTLVIVTEGGGRNVSFEGMRCETRERRAYAFGHPDGTWAKSRSSQWERVREAVNNRHYAALFQEYFCPAGLVVRSAEDAVSALRRGGRASEARW